MITVLKNWFGWAILGCLALGIPGAGSASVPIQDPASSRTAWRLLDYMAVDYGGAVQQGQVVSPAEYAEMTEFAGQARARIAALPVHPDQPALIARATALEAGIMDRRNPDIVAAQARSLAADLLRAYPAPLAPGRTPDLARGERLYAEQCASCHGVSGRGDGIAAAGLDPAPTDFTDVERARQRSAFALYQVINQGLDATAMASFSHLPTDQQWDLAYYVGRFAFSDVQATAGETLWNQQPAIRAQLDGLTPLSQATPAMLGRTIGQSDADALIAYLRRNPGVVLQRTTGLLDIARRDLRASLAAYEAGDRRRATDLALAAYLDGFEPVEPALTARDAALMRRIEAAMGQVRGAIGEGAPAAEVRAKIQALDGLFVEASAALAPDQASAVSSFVGAFAVLLREGLEALLVVVAMIAFLRKARRTDVLPYVHGGWAAALVAGGLTWAAATHLVTISGASRELTEGFGSLIAAAVLISVGLWMHGKGQGDAWQVYIRDKLSRALSKRSAWFLFLLAFIVVYREVFETILFLTALWTQGGGGWMLAGIGAAVVVLSVVGWMMLRLSRTLPIGRFFRYSAVLMAGLAVVLAGKGVAALQEAGLIALRPLDFPGIAWLGVYPTIEGIAAQMLVVGALALGVLSARARSGADR